MIASRPSVQLYPVARISRGGSVLAVLVVGLIGMAACGGSSEPSVPNRPSATAASATAVTTTTDGNLSQAGDDIRVNPELVNEGGDFTTAVPILYDLPSDDPLRTGVSVDTALDLVERVRNIGGYDVGQLQIRLTLESRRNQKIVVSGLDLTDVKESTAIRGTLLRLNEEGGVPNEQLVYNLSDSLPRAHETKADGTIDESPYFMNKSIEVGANEPTVVLAQFNAKPQHSTEFKLRLSYRSAGKSRILDE